MNLSEALRYTTEEIREGVHRVARGLAQDALAWRPDAQANSIAWLLWHLSRVQDAQVAHLADRPPVWGSEWAQRYGLPATYDDTGYAHAAEDVARIAPEDPTLLTDYQDAVAELVTTTLQDMSAEDFDRVVDRSYDPPVTAGVRLLSLTSDALQHLGQAAYLRGLWERRG